MWQNNYRMIAQYRVRLLVSVIVINFYALIIYFLTQSETDFIVVCEILKHDLFSSIQHRYYLYCILQKLHTNFSILTKILPFASYRPFILVIVHWMSVIPLGPVSECPSYHRGRLLNVRHTVVAGYWVFVIPNSMSVIITPYWKGRVDKLYHSLPTSVG